jgi:hypothetical protein
MYTYKEKIDLITHLLKQDSQLLSLLEEDELRDYISCISSFFTTNDPIIAEANIRTMQLIVGKRG